MLVNLSRLIKVKRLQVTFCCVLVRAMFCSILCCVALSSLPKSSQIFLENVFFKLVQPH